MPTLAANLDGLQVRDRLLVFYEEEAEDVGDRYYHDRILLARVSQYEWVVATPHWDLYIEDVRDYAGCFQAGVRGGVGQEFASVLRVRFSQAELLRRLPDLLVDGESEAAQARAPDFAPGAAPAQPHQPGASITWIATEDRGGFSAGDTVAALAGMVVLGDRALLTSATGEVVALAKDGTFVAPEGDADLRTLPVKYSDRAGTLRARPFSDAVSNLTESQFLDWPVKGPRTLRWLLDSMVSSDTSPLRRHFWWRGVLGLSATDEGVEEHEFLSTILEHALVYDQLCISELAAFEHISRRYMLWEESYSSHLKTALGANGGGGFGLDSDERVLFMGIQTTHTALVAPELQTWISGRVAERSAILKERRKGREERALAAEAGKSETRPPKHEPKVKSKAKAKGHREPDK